MLQYASCRELCDINVYVKQIYIYDKALLAR